MAKTLRINAVASRLPIAVNNEKSKQKRLLRFLETTFAIDASQRAGVRFGLERLWQPARTGKHPLILIDETDLVGGWKASVAAVGFRNPAIPMFYCVYSNSEIQDMPYKSHNALIQDFCLRTHQLACEVYPDRQQKPVLIFDRGFARTEYVNGFLKKHNIACVMRVPRNVSVLTQAGWSHLDAVSDGCHADSLYQQPQQLHCHLLVIRDTDFKALM